MMEYQGSENILLDIYCITKTISNFPKAEIVFSPLEERDFAVQHRLLFTHANMANNTLSFFLLSAFVATLRHRTIWRTLHPELCKCCKIETIIY